jgi:hypothetical protein
LLGYISGDLDMSTPQAIDITAVIGQITPLITTFLSMFIAIWFLKTLIGFFKELA